MSVSQRDKFSVCSHILRFELVYLKTWCVVDSEIRLIVKRFYGILLRPEITVTAHFHANLQTLDHAHF